MNAKWILILGTSTMLLSGCVSEIWTGASLVYDRHNVYKKLNDFQLGAEAGRALYHDKLFKQGDCSLELAIFNGDILVVGTVPTDTLRDEAMQRIHAIKGSRRVFNQIAVRQTLPNTLQDAWITTEIRSQIFADASIDPHPFKVVTSDGIVYLMGDVIASQAARVITMARSCPGVRRVVKLMKYYNLSDEPE